MKKQEELVIITKTYDLILWSFNHTSRFPRPHRFVLGSDWNAPTKRTLNSLDEFRIRPIENRMV